MENLGYAQQIGIVRNSIANKARLLRKQEKLEKQLYEAQLEFVNLQDAQKVLATISDDNTEKTLNFITSMVNKVLAEVFKSDIPRLIMTKKLYAGSRPHINVELIDGSGNTLDMSVQSGVGLTQVVSFMYAICLIEIRKGRRILIMDERLNGLHKEAKRIISEVIRIFSEGGFQFVFVEYGLNNLGKMYNVEKHGDFSLFRPVEEGFEYNDDMVFLDSEVDLSVLDKDYVDEEEM